MSQQHLEVTHLEVTMTIQPLSTHVAQALTDFSETFAVSHNLTIHSQQAQQALTLRAKGNMDTLIKLFLRLHTMQQVEQRFAIAS